MLKVIALSSLISASLFPFALEATELKIKYNNFNSTINLSADEVTYSDANTNLSVKKKKCNAHILKNLTKEMDKESNNLLMEKVEQNPMKVSIDGVKYTVDQRSAKGQFFYNYIEVIKKAKIEESLSCAS